MPTKRGDTEFTGHITAEMISKHLSGTMVFKLAFARRASENDQVFSAHCGAFELEVSLSLSLLHYPVSMFLSSLLLFKIAIAPETEIQESITCRDDVTKMLPIPDSV